MRIRWTFAAASDLERIRDYLQEHDPHLARPTVVKLYEGIRSLKTMPRRGRVGREEGTRELVFAHCHTLPRTVSRSSPSKSCISTTQHENGLKDHLSLAPPSVVTPNARLALSDADMADLAL